MTDQRSGGRRPSRPRSGQQQRGPNPVEGAVRSTRRAVQRHAESVRNEEIKLACRGMLDALAAAGRSAGQPAEILGLIEQALRVLLQERASSATLPLTLRAVVDFASQQSGRRTMVVESLRLTIRHAYVLAADHLPRQARDDGGFRAQSLAEALHELGASYMDDAAWKRHASS